MIFHPCFSHSTDGFTLGTVSDVVGIRGEHMRACSAVPSSLRPYGLQPAGLLSLWTVPARIMEWVPSSPSRRGSYV